MSGFLNSLIPTIILLGGLIFIHELGHFWAAKLVDIEVKRFSIGLGPVIWSRTWGETEYALSAIPLGGYVKMGGMADEVMDRVEGGSEPPGGDGDDPPDGVEAEPAVPREPGPRDFDGKPLWARAFVISAGVAMNFIFAFVAYVAIAGLWGVGYPATSRVGVVSAELLPPGTEAVAGIPNGASIERFGDLPIGNYIDLRDAIMETPAGPVVISLSGPESSLTVNLPADPLERGRFFAAIQPFIAPIIGQLESGGPAERGGLETGDEIISFNGMELSSWVDFVAAVEPRGGQRVEIGVIRDGTTLVRAVELESEDKRAPSGEMREGIGHFGVFSEPGETVNDRLSLGAAIEAGWLMTVNSTLLILTFLRDLFTGQTSPRDVGSIVTIGSFSGQAAEQGIEVFLGFMAIFSINLAVLNLLPIPVLDGGHLVFLAIEGIRGKALSLEQRLRWSNVGLVVLMFIMVWALGNDFLRVFGF